MDKSKPESMSWRPAPAEHFTGPVWFGDMSSPEEDQGVKVLGVQFAPGSRTDWHSHPSGQVLHVISGSGVVANRDGERVGLAPGDTVTTPAGEMHWHGADPESPMLHLSITHGGATEWSDEKVTEDTYRG